MPLVLVCPFHLVEIRALIERTPSLCHYVTHYVTHLWEPRIVLESAEVINNSSPLNWISRSLSLSITLSVSLSLGSQCLSTVSSPQSFHVLSDRLPIMTEGAVAFAWFWIMLILCVIIQHASTPTELYHLKCTYKRCLLTDQFPCFFLTYLTSLSGGVVTCAWQGSKNLCNPHTYTHTHI